MPSTAPIPHSTGSPDGVLQPAAASARRPMRSARAKWNRYPIHAGPVLLVTSSTTALTRGRQSATHRTCSTPDVSCRRNGIAYERVTTDTPFGLALRHALVRSTRLA